MKQTTKAHSRIYTSSSGSYAESHAMRRDGLPTLSRVPKEIGREKRHCERCGDMTEHIVYRVPKKIVLVYVKNHENSVQATCGGCARSTVLTGEERARALQGL